MPKLKFIRFIKYYGLSEYDAEILTKDKETAEYFEEAVKVNHELILRPASQRGEQAQDKKEKNTDIKTIANWIVNKKIDINNVLPAQLVQNILASMQTTTINTKALEKIVKEVLEKNPKAVEDYKKGKKQVIGFLIGKVKQTIKQPLDTEQVKRSIEKLTKTR